jgi:hypothetical protein
VPKHGLPLPSCLRPVARSGDPAPAVTCLAPMNTPIAASADLDDEHDPVRNPACFLTSKAAATTVPRRGRDRCQPRKWIQNRHVLPAGARTEAPPTRRMTGAHDDCGDNDRSLSISSLRDSGETTRRMPGTRPDENGRRPTWRAYPRTERGQRLMVNTVPAFLGARWIAALLRRYKYRPQPGQPDGRGNRRRGGLHKRAF